MPEWVNGDTSTPAAHVRARMTNAVGAKAEQADQIQMVPKQCSPLRLNMLLSKQLYLT